MSPRASVALVVTSAAGAVVKSVTVKGVTVGAAATWAFKPTARGTYHVTIAATDLAGNTQAQPATLTLTVK